MRSPGWPGKECEAHVRPKSAAGRVAFRAFLVALVVVVVSGPSRAQNRAPDSLGRVDPVSGSTRVVTDPRPRADEQKPLSARDVRDAPRPDRARNLEPGKPGLVRRVLWLPRAILYLPRWVLRLLAAPLRGGMYLFDRYGVSERLRRLLSGGGPITAFPSIQRESGFSATYGIGARVGPHLKGIFLFGGEIKQIYSGRVRSADLFGKKLELWLQLELQLLKNSRFFGIGNSVLGDVGTGIDAIAGTRAREARFDQDILYLAFGIDWQPHDRLTANAEIARIDREYRSPLDRGFVDIAEAYDTDSLVAFERGARYAYGELRIAYDDRVQTNPYVSLAQPSRGWKLDGFAGYAHNIAGGRPDYLRYGLDLQRYFDLYRGDRILTLRARMEGVSADIDEIPFSELPRLGGSRIMRGYPRGRFRDRLVTALSIEYKYPINRFASAFLFVDAGGAWRQLADVDATDLHLGYGGGVQLHTADLFLTRVLVGGGEDGVVVYVSFTPSSEVERTTEIR